MFRILFATVLIASGIAAASAAETSLAEKQSFYLARAALLRDGWKPIETFDKFPNGDELLHSWGGAKSFYRHGFKEVASCTGVEANYCAFNYRRKDRCLFLVTAGEYQPSGSRYVPTVDNWWTYPVPAKGGCSYDAAHKMKFKKFGQHSFP